MNSTILDLDAPISEKVLNEYKAILYADDVWPILERNASIGIWPGYFDPPENNYDGLDKEEKQVLISVQNECEKIFDNYNCVVAYHCCRTANPDFYHRDGLLTSSQKRLETKAMEIFEGCDGLCEAMQEKVSYFRMYGDSVSLYVSAKYAPSKYLREGSQYFSYIRAKLGIEGTQRFKQYLKETKPYFVQCKLPVALLKRVQPPFRRFEYNATLIRRVICNRTKDVSILM